MFIALLLAGGCSVFRKSAPDNISVTAAESSSIIWQEAINQNVTASNFFISKAEVNFSGRGWNEKFICSVKYRLSGEYLISLRNWTGVEGARIYLATDTVLINDRINRKLYFGSGDKLSQKYGISPKLIPVLFGDIVAGEYFRDKTAKCVNGEVINSQILNGTDIEYSINCKNLKVNTATTGSIRIEFSDYFKLNGKKIPGEIQFEDSVRNIKVTIRIKKIELPWDGEIDFIPGSEYEQIPLI